MIFNVLIFVPRVSIFVFELFLAYQYMTEALQITSPKDEKERDEEKVSENFYLPTVEELKPKPN